jgi:hypothetical protein
MLATATLDEHYGECPNAEQARREYAARLGVNIQKRRAVRAKQSTRRRAKRQEQRRERGRG